MKTKVIISILAVTLLGVAAWVFFGADASATAPTARHTEVATPEEWIARREQIKQLRTELARQGAYAFVTNRETTPSVAPYIHSQCWVDWLPKTNVEQIAYEQEKRDFGLDFVGELEKLALLDIQLEDVDALERHADQMLTIAEWWKTSKGYGNKILSRWCEGIALSAIGGMAINTACETNRIEKLLCKIGGLQPSITWQVGILNEESPHRYTVPRCADAVAAEKDLERQWRSHVTKTGKHYYSIDRKKLFDFAYVKDDPPQYAFYVPSHPNGEYGTVRDWWNIKDHEGVCIHGYDDTMVKNIREVVRFRTRIGPVPRPSATEISKDPFCTEFCSRINAIWRNQPGINEFNFKGASAVVAICRGTFVDWDTRALQRQQGRP